MLLVAVLVSVAIAGFAAVWFVRKPLQFLATRWRWIDTYLSLCLIAFLFVFSLGVAAVIRIPFIYPQPPADPVWLAFALFVLLPAFVIVFALGSAESWRFAFAVRILQPPDGFESVAKKSGYDDFLLVRPRRALVPIIQIFQGGDFELVVVATWAQIERTVNALYRALGPQENIEGKPLSKLKQLDLQVTLPPDRTRKEGMVPNTKWLYERRNGIVHGTRRANYNDAVDALLILRLFLRHVQSFLEKPSQEQKA